MHGILPGIMFGLLMVVLIVGLWDIAREVNYTFSYHSMVEETVREMVGPEALNR
jgi:hypothetical protein